MIFTTEQHWHYFAEFARWEKAAGGPVSKMVTVAKMSEGVPPQEMLWRGGCYIAVYNVPYAEILWQNWPAARMAAEPELLLPWLTEHWKGIVTRINRRCVRRPQWMMEFLLGYHHFITRALPRLLEVKLAPLERYEQLWTGAMEVKFLGRYVALRILEFYNRYCGIASEAPDIRPKDGWSPRYTLSILYPAEAERIAGGKATADIELVNQRVRELQEHLASNEGVPLSLTELQVMLCEYRESYETQYQYPGRTLDSELSYYHKAQAYWGNQSAMLPARAAAFPARQLGELRGWNGGRKELGKVLSEYGYTWSDLLYEYEPGFDLGNPKRSNLETL